VAPDLCFVAHAAKRDADEFPVHRPRDRLSERRLADAGRPDEAENRTFEIAFQLAHSEVLDDPFLHLVEIVMILVEHLACFDRIEAVFRRFIPGNIQDPVEIRPDHLVFRRRRGHAFEAIDLAVGDGGDRLGQSGLGDALAQLRPLAVAFAELGLDRLHLLAQHVLPLRVGHFLFRLRLDLSLQFEHLDFA
jgi:hypothetical protein